MILWIEEMYSFVEAGKTRPAISLLFREVDERFHSGEFSLCNEELKEIDLKRLSPSLLVGLLSITLAAKEKLPYRKELVQKIEDQLRFLCPDRVDRMMKGLK